MAERKGPFWWIATVQANVQAGKSILVTDNAIQASATVGPFKLREDAEKAALTYLSKNSLKLDKYNIVIAEACACAQPMPPPPIEFFSLDK